MPIIFYQFIIPIIVYVIVLVFICCLLLRLLKWLYTTAMTYTRIGFGLLVGLVCVQNCDPIVENGFLNFAIFAAISMVALFLLSVMNRSDCAMRFGATFCVAFIVNTFASGIVYFILNAIFDYGTTSVPAWIVALVTIGSLIFAAWTALQELYLLAPLFAKETNQSYIMVDRVIASLIYGLFIGGAIVIATINKTWFFILVAGVIAVAAFFADKYLLNYLVKSACEVRQEDGSL